MEARKRKLEEAEAEAEQVSRTLDTMRCARTRKKELKAAWRTAGVEAKRLKEAARATILAVWPVCAQ